MVSVTSVYKILVISAAYLGQLLTITPFFMKLMLVFFLVNVGVNEASLVSSSLIL